MGVQARLNDLFGMEQIDFGFPVRLGFIDHQFFLQHLGDRGLNRIPGEIFPLVHAITKYKRIFAMNYLNQILWHYNPISLFTRKI